MRQFRLLFHHALQQRNSGAWRLLAIAAVFLLGCVILFTYSSSSSELDSIPRPGVASSNSDENSASPTDNTKNDSGDDNNDDDTPCSLDLDLLRHYVDNSTTIQYARLNIAVIRTENFTEFPDSLNAPLPKYETIQLDTDSTREPQPEERCAPSVTIEVPLATARPDASHMLFGVATTLQRLEDSLDAFAHWAGNTSTRIVAVVEQGGSSIRKRIESRATELEIRLTIIQNEDDFLYRYFGLVQTLHQHRDDKTLWAVLIDDDTFFPSMRNLVDQFATYDATTQQYIGGMTEDMAQLFGSGYMAYGGAGIFLSIPLLSELQHAFETCWASLNEGDRMVASCIYTHTSTKFTWERGLHQLDLRGDASGFFESGRPLPLSIHHWKSWFQANVVGLGKVAGICGETCLLNRWHLSDDWYLVNGYSIIKDPTHWNKPRPMEQTWDESKYTGQDPFAYSLGPLRRRDGDKISFRLEEAIQEKTDQVRQIYVRNATSEDPTQVLEIFWTVTQDEP